MKIFINPGHCIGVDPGACAFNLQEAQIALDISYKLQSYLQAVGYVTKLFYFDGLDEICNDANSWHADLFVSVHCNAFSSPNAKGSETLFYGSQGSVVAGFIQSQLTSRLHTVDRGAKLSNVYVLKHTNMPAVLVETAFITNPDDAKLLVNNTDEFARAIALGITDYYANLSPLPDTVDTSAPSSSKLGQHFDISEFACHHCGTCTDIHPRLIELLEQLRKNIGNVPIHINSGYRCPTHNANVGGVPNSQHVLGTAADLAVPNSLTFEAFKYQISKLPFDWVGLYPYSNFIHVDTRCGGVSHPPTMDWME